MIRIAICGIAGRMGAEVLNAVLTTEDIEVVAGAEAMGHKLVGSKIKDVKICDNITEAIEQADCLVDFTNHAATMENLRRAKKFKKPYVIGTTGFSEEELKEIKNLSKIFPILLSPNMSLGINHLYNIMRSTVHALGDYDIEIIETHHRGKKDAPSGTAKAIADIIREQKPGTKFIHGREGMVGERKKGEVCINVVRGGDIIGEHRVLFLSNGEFIELRHFATSRQCFAYGTIKAIRFIHDKPPGLYTMQDVLFPHK